MEELLFDEAFKMYDAHGLSLSEQHDILSIEHPGIKLNLYKFAIDAAEHGWSNKKILSTIKDYCSENDIKLRFVERQITA